MLRSIRFLVRYPSKISVAAFPHKISHFAGAPLDPPARAE